MKSTKYDYTSLVLFILSTISTIVLYITAYGELGNKGQLILVAIVTSILATITCPGLSTIWLNRIYNKHISENNLRFYGKTNILKEYQVQTGEWLRAVVFISYLFVAPAIITGKWIVTLISFCAVMVLALMVYINIKEYKTYLYQRSEKQTLPNSP